MNSLFLNNLHVKRILGIAPNWRFYLSKTILGVFSTHSLHTKLGWDNILVSVERRIRLLQLGSVLLG